ncbi:MAG: DEAD/DEAH box helicase [Verrucomicrobia bacterium]|nr:DEAD/DEAH box helicase [Verrucomicrobiota bacterium]
MIKLDGPTLRRAMHADFDSITLAKGTIYYQQRRVFGCVATPDRDAGWFISASVRGSRATPYQVNVELFDDGGELGIESDCTCPVEFDCKHVVAVLEQIAAERDEWTNLEFAGNGFQNAKLPTLPSPQTAPNPLLQSWLREISAAATKNTTGLEAPQPKEEPERLIYILRHSQKRLMLELAVVRPLKKGGYGQARPCNFSTLLYNSAPARFVRPVDIQLVRKLMLAQREFNAYQPVLEGDDGVELLQGILATGRCHWQGTGKHHRALALGAARPTQPVWRADQRGYQRPAFHVEPPVTDILPLSPPWYVDETAGECGPLETGLPVAVAAAWLHAPAISPEEAVIVASDFSEEGRSFVLPAPRHVEVAELKRIKPTPCLRLYSARLKKHDFRYNWPPRAADKIEIEKNFAFLDFDYEGVRIQPHIWKPVLEHYADGKLQRIGRNTRKEQEALRLLQDAGLEPAADVVLDAELGPHTNAHVCRDENDWLDFSHIDVPELRENGWRVDIDDSFQYRIVEPEGWFTDAAAEEGRNDWFGVELGVMVEGQKINLLPVLLKLLQSDPQLLQSEELAQNSDAVIAVPLPDGRKVLFPAGRARQLLGVLLELLNPNSLNASGQLRLPKLRAAELAGEADWRWLGATELRDLSSRLRSFSGIKPVAPSPNLRATLRPYQQDGLNWLQFLREYELAGVLADDMGLGKTVQTLAHLLVEKESGRMDRPSLVVAPTSLMTNWRQETERFAPDLRVLVLHGLDRKQHFSRIAEHDLVVTSYALLPRDQEVLQGHEFHYVILDEAQFIKNPKTQYAQIACALKARHHLCLTGTPMENHLGELWSLFHFLLPGFLGDLIRFQSLFRRPIEKGKNDDRRKLLARRVAPFILRRKKDEVVKELPPKTEIVQNVELAGAQRDLYESVRLAMHERVKQEVAKKGFSRAHIIILDALLKLRQICCHPQLLSLPSAQRVKESAKLDLLLDLVPEMIAEGRRILLFSQFTSMLAIIQEKLAKMKIPYVLLTGDTRDRSTPVQRFQNGEVPLFLISLKAGGTGLNLTAADTVIHYDPWWNPAVENQATDRAHRIGQDKKVFVYKLMTVGTVEEKIAAMQARKRELVEGLLNEERPDHLKLTGKDLDVLFAPLQ